MDKLKRDLASQLPQNIGIGLCAVTATCADLLPGESDCIPRAVDKRRHEFAAGRRAARAAMAGIGHPPSPVLLAADRSPVWPTGLVGSISHDRDRAIALVARKVDFRSVGIDVEPNEPLPEDVRSEVLIGDDSTDTGTAGHGDRVIFCAKEASYKCLYPLTREVIGFDAMVVTFPAKDRFRATLTRSTGPFSDGFWMDGVLVVGAECIVAVTWQTGGQSR